MREKEKDKDSEFVEFWVYQLDGIHATTYHQDLANQVFMKCVGD